jgi:acetyl-CoA C-acetyltransferase
VKDVNGITILAHDEHMRPTTTMQSLAQLQPSFVQMGEMYWLRRGGGSGLSRRRDRHARAPRRQLVRHRRWRGAVLIGNKEAGAKAGLKPRARIRAFANIGSEPAIMLTGPIDVTNKVLKKAGMTVADIDLFELNEAFASVVLRYMQALDIPHDKINVAGGAIAMGHPLGATGAMIFGTVLDELERPQSQDRAGDALHRRRHGNGDNHRAGVIARPCRRSIRPSSSPRESTNYPDAFKHVVKGREKTALGNAADLSQFGVN